MSEIVENRREVTATITDTSGVQSEDKSAAGALETALAACEDDQDVQVRKYCDGNFEHLAPYFLGKTIKFLRVVSIKKGFIIKLMLSRYFYCLQAAKIAKAEAVADLAEFDENIPLEQDTEREPEVVSKAEQEINNIIKKVTTSAC